MAARKTTTEPALGVPREVEGNAALVEEIHRTVGHIAKLGEIVDAIPKDELVEGVTKVVEFEGGEDGGGTRTVTTETAPNIWLRLYQAERKHLLDLYRTAAVCGVAMKPAREKDAIDDLAAKRAKRRSGVAAASDQVRT